MMIIFYIIQGMYRQIYSKSLQTPSSLHLSYYGKYTLALRLIGIACDESFPCVRDSSAVRMYFRFAMSSTCTIDEVHLRTARYCVGMFVCFSAGI
jgi:hypothetical protein